MLAGRLRGAEESAARARRTDAGRRPPAAMPNPNLILKATRIVRRVQQKVADRRAIRPGTRVRATVLKCVKNKTVRRTRIIIYARVCCSKVYKYTATKKQKPKKKIYVIPSLTCTILTRDI